MIEVLELIHVCVFHFKFVLQLILIHFSVVMHLCSVTTVYAVFVSDRLPTLHPYHSLQAKNGRNNTGKLLMNFKMTQIPTCTEREQTVQASKHLILMSR